MVDSDLNKPNNKKNLNEDAAATGSNEELTADQIRDRVDEQSVDPRDLVTKGGYRKHPREMVENPAVTPQMLNETQEAQAGFSREGDDEAD
jgi:hypothetical protein